MLNEVTLIGNIGKAPEVNTMKNGKTMAKITLATTKKWKDASGEKKEKTEWHNVIVWNDGLAKVIERYTSKGSKIYVKGEIQTRKYQDKSGKDCYTTEIIVTDSNHTILLMDAKPQTGNAHRPAPQRQQARPNLDLDDEIGF